MGRAVSHGAHDKGPEPILLPGEHRSRDAVPFRAATADNLLRGVGSDAFAGKAVEFLAYLNAIHPFREGNGRTQLTFMAMLAAYAGHPLDLSLLEPAGFLQAMIASFFGDEGPLREQIRRLLMR